VSSIIAHRGYSCIGIEATAGRDRARSRRGGSARRSYGAARWPPQLPLFLGTWSSAVTRLLRGEIWGLWELPLLDAAGAEYKWRDDPKR
jgi:hypothetical protein